MLEFVRGTEMRRGGETLAQYSKNGLIHKKCMDVTCRIRGCEHDIEHKGPRNSSKTENICRFHTKRNQRCNMNTAKIRPFDIWERPTMENFTANMSILLVFTRS